jgi:hypothetical protein
MSYKYDYDLGGTLKREKIYSKNYFQDDAKCDFLINSNRYGLFELFQKLPVLNTNVAYTTNTDFEVLGTNATATQVTRSSTIGALQLATAGTTNDSTIILPHLDTDLSAWTGVKWGTENQVCFEAVIRTATITAVTIWAGLKLTNTPVIATDNDQAMFRFSTADSNTTFRAVYSVGGTDTNVDTGVTVVANTNYKLAIELDSNRRAHFIINDKEYAVSSALTNDVDLIPYIGVLQEGATAKNLNIVYEKISRVIFE